MLVVGVALDALRDVVEDVLVALGLELGGLRLVAGLPERGDVGVVLLGLDDRVAQVELRVLADDGAGLVDRVERLVVPLLLEVEVDEREVVVDVLRLLLDLAERLGDDLGGVVRGLHGLVRGVELLDHLLVLEGLAEVAGLGRLLPRAARVERLGVLEHLADRGVRRACAVDDVEALDRLRVVLRLEVELAEDERRVDVVRGDVLLRELHRHQARGAAAGGDRRLGEELHEMDVQRIVEEQLLALGEGLGVLLLLHQARDLHLREEGLRGGERAHRHLAVVLEEVAADLGLAQVGARLEEPGAGGDAAQQHVDRQVGVALERSLGLDVEVADVLGDGLLRLLGGGLGLGVFVCHIRASGWVKGLSLRGRRPDGRRFPQGLESSHETDRLSRMGNAGLRSVAGGKGVW